MISEQSQVNSLGLLVQNQKVLNFWLNRKFVSVKNNILVIGINHSTKTICINSKGNFQNTNYNIGSRIASTYFH